MILLNINEINYIFSDKPNNLMIPTNKIENYTGVTYKTLKNIFYSKHKPRQSTKDKIASNLSNKLNQIPGISFDQEKFLENFDIYSAPVDWSDVNLDILDVIKDEYIKYSTKIYYEILTKHIEIMAFIKNSEKNINLKNLVDYIYNCGLPDYMVNTLNIESESINSFRKSIILLLFDVIFYISSAYEVEYNKIFLKCDESRMTKFLPVLKQDELVNPIARWFDFIMHNCKIESNNEFALMFPKISEHNSENDINNDSKERQMKRWRKGTMLPSFKNIDKMIEKVSREKMSLTVYEEIEESKERGRYVYAYIKIFQRFLNVLKSEINNPALNLNNQKVESFFKRYEYWYTYHSANISQIDANLD